MPTLKRETRSATASIAMAVAVFLPQSRLTSLLRYSALSYLFIDMLLKARTGYVRRRVYWTLESWQRYLIACLIPVGAIAICMGMAEAVDFKPPWVGASHSAVRALWVGVMMVFMVIGGVGLISMIECLSVGDASRQFTRSPWRFWSTSQRATTI
jgi:hypothetical protein